MPTTTITPTAIANVLVSEQSLANKLDAMFVHPMKSYRVVATSNNGFPIDQEYQAPNITILSLFLELQDYRIVSVRQLF